MRTKLYALLALPLFALACGAPPAAKDKDTKSDAGKADADKPADKKADDAAKPADAPPAADTAAAAIVVPETMTNFLAKFDGTDAGVSAALKEFGVEGLADAEMSLYMLKDPKVTAANGDCYTFTAAAGMTERSYEVCWKDGKIEKVVDKDAAKDDE